MQPNCSLPCSHQPATRIHATDFHPISLTCILILSLHPYLGLLNFFVAQVSHQEIPMHSPSLSCMPHALSISSPQSYVHTMQMITKNRSACACRRIRVDGVMGRRNENALQTDGLKGRDTTARNRKAPTNRISSSALSVQKEQAQTYGWAQSAGGVSWGGTSGKEAVGANFRVTSRLL
jgi:hypothetical protein